MTNESTRHRDVSRFVSPSGTPVIISGDTATQIQRASDSTCDISVFGGKTLAVRGTVKGVAEALWPGVSVVFGFLGPSAYWAIPRHAFLFATGTRDGGWSATFAGYQNHLTANKLMFDGHDEE